MAVVKTQMDSGNVPGVHGVGGGTYGANTAPFNKPQDTGGGGIPTKFFDGTSDRVGRTMPAPGQSGMAGNGLKRPGTKEYPFGNAQAADE